MRLPVGEAWSVVKENATAVLAPAKDVVMILDSITKYIPALMVAESVFAVRYVPCPSSFWSRVI